MSWASRFGSWGGRFSPFGRPEAEYDDANGNKDHVHGSVPADAKITDGDFSYITSADLAAVEEAGGLEPERQPSQQQSTTTQTRDDHHHNKHKSHHHSSKHNGHHATSGGVPIYDGSGDKPSTVEAASPNRETDVLVLKHKRIAHPVHFPAFSIARGELHVGEIRSCAAQRLKVHAPRKVKLLHRGRNLRDDSQTAQDAGLAAGGEIMCIVGDSLGGGRGERYHASSSSGNGGTSDVDLDYDHDDYYDHHSTTDHDEATGAYHSTLGSADASGIDTGADSSTPFGKSSSSGGKRRRTRQKKKQNNKHRDGSISNTDGGNDNMPNSHLPPPRSHPSAAPAAAPPSTPLGQLSAVAHTFRADLLPQCLAFEAHPPTDTSKREFEHRRLTETVLAQVLLKLDAVETDGDAEARKMRKELVKECQGVLGRLDEAVK